MIIVRLVRALINIFDIFQQRKIINFFKKKISITKEIEFFDVGSHFGETVELFYKNFKIKKIHCFEASPINFDILKKNIENNGLTSICDLNNFGVGHKNFDSHINQTKESSSSTINDLNLNSSYLKRKLKILNIKKKDNFYKKIPIKVKILDDYVKEKKIKQIDILKIDTEGFEYNVIRGIEKSHNIIRYIYFEHHYDDMIIKNYKFNDINKILIKFGFKKIYKSKMYFRKSFEYIYENSIT
jgi:FkbM family methyltransferase